MDNEFFISMIPIELMINSHDESVGKYVMMSRFKNPKSQSLGPKVSIKFKTEPCS